MICLYAASFIKISSVFISGSFYDDKFPILLSAKQEQTQVSALVYFYKYHIITVNHIADFTTSVILFGCHKVSRFVDSELMWIR